MIRKEEKLSNLLEGGSLDAPKPPKGEHPRTTEKRELLQKLYLAIDRGDEAGEYFTLEKIKHVNRLNSHANRLTKDL